MATTAEKVQTVRDYVAGCIGSEHFFRHWTGALVYTDGVNLIGDTCGAHWLIDLIASYQPQLRDESFQLWILEQDGARFEARCEDGNGKRLLSQIIEATDFPLELLPLSLYCERGAVGGAATMVLMIPEER